MADKLRCAVIGTGGIANGAHLPGYSLIPDDCEIFTYKDILIDKMLDIELNLSEIFR